MKFNHLLLCLLLLTITVNSRAGRYPATPGNRHKSGAKTTLSDPGEENYDMKYLKFNLHLSDTSVYVWGDVSTTAQVVVPSTSSYIFELDTVMSIDSAKVNGSLVSVATAGYIRTISLPTAFSSGTLFTAQIFYHGYAPPAPPTSFFNAMTHGVTTGGTSVVYTISDPWVALDWWPAKQDVDDKIDSVDMFITVPRGVTDGSNGVLVSVDTSSHPGFSTFHWQTHYPITYYLISVAVARYVEDTHYMHFTGSTDSMLIQNFFMDTTTFYPAYKSNFDSIDQIINYYCSLYGRYPFWQEKYGVTYSTLPGGMENQTMTNIGVTNTYIIAHELCHQWFGDHVSYADWGDTWMSEGFATFSEQLFLTHFWGNAAGLAHRQTMLSFALGSSCGELLVTDTTNAGTIFNYSTTYAKGQGVVTMLRYLAPTDSIFFQALRNYQTMYAFSNAHNADLQAVFESVYGFSLDTFFHEWVYGKGFPRYRVTWDQYGSSVTVKLIQTRSCITYDTTFSTALELQLHSATADTYLQVYNNVDTQIYTFNWAPTMSTVYLNPDIWTICEQLGTSKQDTTLRYLGIGSIHPDKIKVFPNPSKDQWQIENVVANTNLTLTDVSGKVIWQGTSNRGITIIPGDSLPAGTYYLMIGDTKTDSIKLVHW